GNRTSQRPRGGTMTAEGGGSLWKALGGLIFPVVPALLATAGYKQLNLGGADPRVWDAGQGGILIGPLWGYGFLAGATVGLPDDPGRRGLQRLLARRALWVAVGPWAGFLAVVGWYLLMLGIGRAVPLARRLVFVPQANPTPFEQRV